MAGESATRITPGFALRPEDIAQATHDGSTPAPSEDVARYALGLGDDGLILAQRLGNWISRAPELEEDVALGNIGLDQLGHARSFLTYAGSAWGKTEDDLAYWRGEDEFTSVHLVEQPNGDFAHTIARQLILASYQKHLYAALMNSSDATLAAIAAKAVKEVDYHLDHATQWILRLGVGTEESRRRMIAGLTNMWPYVEELFTDTDVIESLAAEEDTAQVAVRPSSLREPVLAEIASILAEAELDIPDVPHSRGGGRNGQHSEHLGYLLAEMQVLARQHPGASW